MKSLEGRVNKIEAELEALLRQETLLPTSLDWWMNKAMRQLCANPELRTQTFSFIEAFPEFRDAEDIYTHLSEYFAPSKIHLPVVLRGAYFAKDLPGAKSFLAWAAEKAVRTVARYFLVPSSRKDIELAIQKLNKLGAAYSLAILGEAVVSEQEAELYKDMYAQMIRRLTRMGQDVDVSVKISSLYSQFHPLAGEDAKSAVKKRLGGILLYAWAHGGGVTIDTEQYRFRDLTLEIFQELVSGEFSKWRGLSIAHQTYLKDSWDTLVKLARFAQGNVLFFGVRLVKGAYWDYEVINAQQQSWPVPVYTERQETDESFERNVDIALGHYPHIRTAVGTHNLRSLAYAMAKQEDLGLPKEALEVQLLYGMGNSLIRPVRKFGYPVRVYVGVGDLVKGMSFLMRRLLENTSQMSSAFFAPK